MALLENVDFALNSLPKLLQAIGFIITL